MFLVLVLHKLIVLFHLLPFLLNYLLIYLENFVRLPSKLQRLELESGFNEHKDRHLGFQGESISWQIISVDCLLKFTDLLRAKGEDLEQGQKSFDA